MEANGFGDDLFNAFFGAVNWQQRVRKTIDFVAPNGVTFSGKWIGSPRSRDKKVAFFPLPGVKGDIIQDLEHHADKYPIKFFFDGKDHDKVGDLFFKSTGLKGLWTVTHPVYGIKDLQLLTVQEDQNPVEHGGITEFTTEWAEPLDPDNILSDVELSVTCKLAALELQGNALDQFVAGVEAGVAAYENAVATVTQGIANVTNMILSPITSLVDAVDATFNATQQGIQDVSNATTLEVRALAGQTQLLIETPADSIASIEDKLEAYGQLDDEFSDMLDSIGDKYKQLGAKTEAILSRNSIAPLELALVSSFVGSAYSVLKAPVDPKSPTGYATRAQAQATIGELFDRVEATAAMLEARQRACVDAGVTIDRQYFAQTQTFAGVRRLQALLTLYLKTIQFDLKVEKRFKLSAAKAPILVCIEEYGDLGENDANWDLFCNSNDLHGRELLMLPAGKEVVVYA